MFGLLSLLKKEFTLLSRDVHALMVLFIMPAAFILIMSLSLQDKFQEHDSNQIKIGLIYQQAQDQDHYLGKQLAQLDGFDVKILQPATNLDQTTLKALRDDNSLIAIIVIPQHFFGFFDAEETPPEKDRIRIIYAPTAPLTVQKLLSATLSRQIAEHQVEQLLSTYLDSQEAITEEKQSFFGDHFFVQSGVYTELDTQAAPTPTSVEQTVPAWLIFAMFFVVIPLSTTFIQEHQYGTLQRLQTLPVPQISLLLGKLLPYIGINLVQVLLMFLVGIFVLPLLGGQGIELQANAWLLLPFSLVTSFAAVSFALFIASIVKTSEQATTIGGVSNLILAAIGGIMVPTFVMPPVMQTVAAYSPMNWGLEGYLDIILRHATWSDILPEFIKLAIFGALLFAASLLFFSQPKR